MAWKNYATSHVKSCGKCASAKFFFKNMAGKVFGRLSVSRHQPMPPAQTSKTPWLWNCSCGGSKSIIAGSVVNGLTTSCGCAIRSPNGLHYRKPVMTSKAEWVRKFPSLIDESLPTEWSFGSNMLVPVRCKCGGRFVTRFNKLKTTSTCGCKVPVEGLIGRRWGRLVCSPANPPNMNVAYGSGKPILFDCDCGKTRAIGFASVFSGRQSTCGSCNLRDPSWWNGRQFGKLTVYGVSKSLSTKSEQSVPCKCVCGRCKDIFAYSLTNGRSKSCGECVLTAYEWRNTRTPFVFKPNGSGDPRTAPVYNLEELLTYFKGFTLTPLEPCKKTTQNRWRCNLCESEFRPRLHEILDGTTSSCGCTGSQSWASAEMFDYVKSLDPSAKKEVKVAGKKFDVVVGRVAIEYHGLYFHSRCGSMGVDAAKRHAAIRDGYTVLSVYADEWEGRKQAVKSLIANRIGKSVKNRVRPHDCEVAYLSPSNARTFHEANHYDGFVGAKWHVAVKYGGVVVACMSIGTPTRQAGRELQIHRMSSDGSCAVMGVWSFLLKRWAHDCNINSVVSTFSDNRLSEGNVYQRVGMTHVGDVAPDYYWVKGNRRFHKSALRKTDAEKLTGKTEEALRIAQGYRKLWDHGKRKWAMMVGNPLLLQC